MMKVTACLHMSHVRSNKLGCLLETLGYWSSGKFISHPSRPNIIPSNIVPSNTYTRKDETR